MSVIKITLTARLAPPDEPAGVDVQVEVAGAGMPDKDKALIGQQLAEHAITLLAQASSRVLQLPTYPPATYGGLSTPPGVSVLPCDTSSD